MEVGKSMAEGEVTEKFTSDVTRTIKGTKVLRCAASDQSAYFLKQKDGNRVLRSESGLKGKS